MADKELFGNSEQLNDLISRRAAIDAIDRLDIPEDMCVFEILSHIELEIGTLSPAQPEIIRCRNCKFASGDSRICMKFGHSPIGELDFCAWAERRTDG